jgi:hypothetical protein
MIDVYEVVVLKFDEYEMKSMIIDCIIVKHVFDVYLMNLNRVHVLISVIFGVVWDRNWSFEVIWDRNKEHNTSPLTRLRNEHRSSLTSMVRVHSSNIGYTRQINDPSGDIYG